MTDFVKKSLFGWGAISQHIIYARFQTRFLKTSIIQNCFLTEEHSDLDKFYNCLKSVIDRIPKHNLHFVMAHINAKVDTTTKEWKEQQGSLGEELINQNPRVSCMCFVSYLILTCKHTMNMKFARLRKSQNNVNLCFFPLPNRSATFASV